MKNLTLLVLALVVGAVCLGGCNKTEDANNAATTPTKGANNAAAGTTAN